MAIVVSLLLHLEGKQYTIWDFKVIYFFNLINVYCIDLIFVHIVLPDSTRFNGFSMQHYVF